MTPEERKAAKAAKRAANREGWKFHPANANAAWMQKQAELEAAVGIVADPIDTAVAETGSLAKLRAIMADPGTPLYRRLDAAEVVLTYELGPGAAVGLDPDQIAVGSFRFLKAVSEAAETPEPL